jgi:sterol desaturase/sphingolipid hydroxylase (fatty acid hydroxylase superfamily)
LSTETGESGGMIVELFLIWACFFTFGLLAKLYPCNPGQPKFISRETPTDLIYAGMLLLGGGVATSGATAAALGLIYGPDAAAAREAIEQGRGALAALPLWSQILLILVISDVIQYWLHRAFHWGPLWPFHAIHHSSRVLDWITTYRVHPVNYALYSTSVSALVMVLGFSPVALAVLGPLNFVHAALVHANLDWDYGPFRYVLASPVFHRWHHADENSEAHDKNFAPTFPILDVIFGTFYMPKGVLPEGFGVEGAPSEGFLAQLVYPFKALAARRGVEGAASQPGG